MVFFSLFYWLNYLVLIATGALTVGAAVCFFLFLVLIAYPAGNMIFTLLNGEKALLDPYFADIARLLLCLPPIFFVSITIGISTRAVLSIAIPSMTFSFLQMARRADMIGSPPRLSFRLNPFKERVGMVRLAFLASAVLTTAALISMFQLTEHKAGYILFNPEVADTSHYWASINSMVKHKGALLEGFNLTNLSGLNIRDPFHDIGFFYFLTLIVEICEAQVANLFNIDAVVVHSILWAEFGVLLLAGACFFPATQREALKGEWITAASGIIAFLFFSLPVLIGWEEVTYLAVYCFRSGHIAFSSIALIVAIKLFLSFDKAFGLRGEAPKIIITSALFFLAAWIHPITGLLFFLSWIVALLLHSLREKWDMEIKPQLAVLAVVVFSAIALIIFPPLGASLKLSTYEAASSFSMMRIMLSTGGNAKLLPFAAVFLGWVIWHYYGQRIIAIASNRKRGAGTFLVLMGLTLTIMAGIYLLVSLKSGGMSMTMESIKTWIHAAQPGSSAWYAAFVAQEMTNLSKAIATMLISCGIWIPLVFIFFKTANRLHRSYMAILFTSIFLVIWIVPSPGTLVNTGRLGAEYMARNTFLSSFFMIMAIAPPLFPRMRLGFLAKVCALALASACAVWFNHFSSFLHRENLYVPEKLYSALEYIKSGTDMETVVLMNTPFQYSYALVSGYAGRGAVAERAVYFYTYAERADNIKYFYGHAGFDSRKMDILRKYAVTHIMVSGKDRLNLPRTHFVAVYANSDYILYRYNPAAVKNYVE